MFPLTTATKSHKLRGFKGQRAPRQPGKRYHPASPPRFPGPNYPCPLLHTLQTGTKSGGPHDGVSQESPNPPQTAGALRSLLSRASTSTGVSRPFCSHFVHPPRAPCLDIGDPHTCFHPAVLGAPSSPPPLLQPHQPAISALVRAFAQGQSPRWHRPRDRPARVQGPPRRGARGSWEAVGREPACSGRPGLAGDPYLLSRGPSRLAPHQAAGQTDRTRLPRSACGGGQPPPPKPPRSNSPGHAPLPRRLRLSGPGREAGAEPGRQLSESEFQRNVSVPSGVRLGVLALQAVRAGGFLVALSRDWQPRLKPPSLPFRHRAPHAGPTEDFELTQLGPSGQGRGWGGRRWHYCAFRRRWWDSLLLAGIVLSQQSRD